MASFDELGRVFRRYMAGYDRYQGTTSADTLGNQATPIHDTSAGEVSSDHGGRTTSFPDQDATGPAYQGAPNSFGWREQGQLQVGPARESIVQVTVPAGDTLVIDPAAAITWVATIAGSVSITFAPDAVVQGLDELDYLPPYASHVVLILRRAAGAMVTWPEDLLWPDDLFDPENLVAPDPSKAKIDTFTFHKLPPSADDPDMPAGWFAYLGARGFATRTTTETAATGAIPDVS